jgi:hypothetical protein
LESPEWLALSEHTRAALLEKYRDINVDYDWWEFTYEDFQHQQLEDNGINVENMYFSGFWSQGDGACFEGSVDDWYKFLTVTGNKTLIPLLAALDEYPRFSCRHTGRYSHEYSVDYSTELDLSNPFDEDEEPLRFVAWAQATADGQCFTNLEDAFMEFFRDQMRALYQSLETEHDYQTDDERVVEALISNEMLDDLQEDEDDETY